VGANLQKEERMKSLFKRVVVGVLVLMMTLSIFFGECVSGFSNSIFNDSTVSKWAIDELTQAYSH
jgi:hypothetical protein